MICFVSSNQVLTHAARAAELLCTALLVAARGVRRALDLVSPNQVLTHAARAAAKGSG